MKLHCTLIILLAFFVVSGCSDDSGSGTANTNADTGVVQDSSTDNTLDSSNMVQDSALEDDTAQPDTSSEADTSASDTQNEADVPLEMPVLTLPQAVSGAMWANPEVYATIPVRVVVEGQADRVEVVFDTETFMAEDPDGDGVWVAMLPIGTFVPGDHTIKAIGYLTGATQGSVEADLILGTEGVQFTDWNVAGSAGTPRLHRRGSELWLSWTDSSMGRRGAWLQQIDGAGRRIGEPVRLSPEDRDVLFARVVFGREAIGVLYQEPEGGPYHNMFRVVAPDGSEIVAPIALEPDDRFGSWGGDIAFDGEAFVIAWRTNGGDGSTGEVRWMRIVEESKVQVGPVVVAASGDNNPDGGFLPFSFVRLEAGERSVVTFVRERYDTVLELSVQTSQAAVVDREGNVVSEGALPAPSIMFPFYHEAHVHRVGNEAVPLWTFTDLLSEEINAPHILYGARVALDNPGAPASWEASFMLEAPDARGEFTLVGHPDHFAVMAWTDNRSYAGDVAGGRIELWVAGVEDALGLVESHVFPHARFIAGTADIGGVALGRNAVLTWIDERHGGGVLNPRPEVWLETAWY